MNRVYVATEKYVDNFQEYDISKVLTRMIRKLGIKNFQVYPYRGVFTNSTNYKKIVFPTTHRYNIGITSINMDDMDHYTAFIENEGVLYVWDSTYSNMAQSDIVELYKKWFPKHVIVGINTCDACFQNFSDDNQYQLQNIFCHTWCVWWIHNVFFHISKGYSISDALHIISSMCSTPLQNLITIKQFAKALSLDYLDYETLPYFDYVIHGGKVVKVL